MYNWRLLLYLEIKKKYVGFEYGQIHYDLDVDVLYKQRRIAPKISKLFQWFLRNKSKLKFCSNPECNHVIHVVTIFGQIIEHNILDSFLEIINNKIQPIFLCCECHNLTLSDSLKKYDYEEE